jgi:hypothetical protein
MKWARAAACTLFVSVFGCATGVEPTSEQQPVDVGGSDASANTAGSNAEGGTAGSGGAGVGGVVGVGGMAGAGIGGALAGSAGVGGAAATGGAGAATGGASTGGGGAATGGGGSGGQGGAGGASGNGGAGGMPSTVKPSSLTVSSTKNATARQAPGAGGTVYDDSCPAGQVLIGFNGTVGADVTYVRSVSGVCGTLALQAQAPYAITVSKAGNLPLRMTAQATAQSALCPANQVVVGFAGTSGGYIDSLKFKCAPLSVSGQAPNYTLSIGTASDTGSIGGAAGGSAFTAISCAAGQVAVSQRPNAGNAIDSFGMACAEVKLVVQ